MESGIKKAILRFPARFGLTRCWRLVRPAGVPVLTLHGVLPDRQARLFNATGKFISPEKLKGFLNGLCRLYKPLSLDELVEALAAGRAFRNRFVLTFDDGYTNVYTHAYPLLREMGIPFAVFVTTGMVDTDTILWNDLLEFAVFSTAETVMPGGFLEETTGLQSYYDRQEAIIRLKQVLKRRNLEEAREQVHTLCAALGVGTEAPELREVGFLTSDRIKEMSEGGVVFGGHTVTHPILSRETPGRVRSEVAECKEYLESVTGKQITCFAYPNGQRGDYNEMVIQEVRRAGYRAAFTGITGLAYPGTDAFGIKRVLVDCRWTYEEFETRASGILEIVGR